MDNKENNIKLKTLENLDDVDTIDLASALSDYSDEEIIELTNKLDNERMAGVLEEAEKKKKKRLLKNVDNKRVLQIFSYMAKDDIVDVLGDISVGQAKDLIRLMK